MSTPYLELVTTRRLGHINLRSTFGVSDLNDVVFDNEVQIARAAYASFLQEVNGEIELQTTTTSKTIRFSTKERGLYIAGYVAEAGIGVRVPVLPTGNAFIEWGYFDDQNGYGFGVDATGVYVFRRKLGVSTKTYQSSWNIDPLNGKGVSGITLDLSAGNVFNMNILWYGYGQSTFAVLLDEGGMKRFTECHNIQNHGEITIVDPDQPVSVRISNGSTGSNLKLYLGGRQFSIYGSQDAPSRRSSAIRLNRATALAGTYVLSVRKKATFRGRLNTVATNANEVDLLTTTDLLWEFWLGVTLTGTPSWTSMVGIPADESACEYDVAATGFTGGILIASGFAVQGARNNQPGLVSRQLDSVLSRTDILALKVTPLATIGSVNAVVDVVERW